VKIDCEHKGIKVGVYCIELCHYGDRGDFEVFPDQKLDLDLLAYSSCLAGQGYDIDFKSKEVLIFKQGGVEFTLSSDGRLIIENLAPGSNAQAVEEAMGVVGYG